MRTTLWRLRSLFPFDRLSILQRVSGGVCIVLVLLVGLSISSWRTIASVYEQAKSVNSSVSQASAMAQLATRVVETRGQVTQYALSENDSDLRAAERALDSLQQDIVSVTAEYKGSEIDATVNKLAGLADQYRNSVMST